jgi:mono/diheme cytochrome c family protein
MKRSYWAIARSVVIGVGMIAVGIAPVRAAGEAENGEALAQKWCGSCHVISEAAAAGMEGLVAPMFMEFEVTTAAEVKAAIAPPHPSMPGFSEFTDQDFEDLTAYIQSVADE